MSKYIKSQDRELNHIISKLIQVQHDKGQIKGSTDGDQSLSILLTASGIIDGGCTAAKEKIIGSIVGNLINVCERNGTSIETCLNKYWESQK